MTFDLALTLFVAFFLLFLGSTVFFNDRRSVSNALFFFISLATVLWGVSNYFSITVAPDKVLFWVRLVLFFAAPHAVFFMLFMNNFPRRDLAIKKSLLTGILLLLGGVMAATLTPYIFSETIIRNASVVPVPGPLIPIFGLLVIGSVGSAIIIAIRKYRQAVPEDKKQWKYMLVGVSVSYSLLILTNFILVSVAGNTFFVKYAVLLMLPTFAGMSYAILRHHLLNVKVITTELVVFALLSVSLLQITAYRDFSDLVIKIIIFGLTGVFSALLVKSVRVEVSQREQLQKLTGQLRQANVDLMVRNRYLAALQSLTGEITRSLNFNKFTQDIVDGVATKLGFAGGVLFLVKKEKLEIAAVTKSRLFTKALGYLPQSLFSYSGNLNDNNLTVLAIRTGRIQIGSDLHSFISPPLPKGLTVILQNALRVRSIMAVPILSENKVLGCLVVAGRATRENTTDNEIQMIKALADEVGIVTRNLTLYEQLEIANTRLIHANEELSRLDKAKTEFLSIASHQLRTPLTAIKGYMSMILDKDYGPYPEKMETPFKDVFESAQRLIALVNDLLDVSRIASGRLELHIQAVDIVKLTGSVIDEIRPKANNKGIDLVVENKTSPNTFVKADEEKLRQVVINLVDNAIKYTPQGRVVVRIENNGPRLKYSVVDSGIGLTADEIPQLFHRFMRTPEAVLVETEGTGLGLYVAKTIIEALDGKIWVESQGIGKGSSFIFELPEAKPGFTGGEVIKVRPKENAA